MGFYQICAFTCTGGLGQRCAYPQRSSRVLQGLCPKRGLAEPAGHPHSGAPTQRAPAGERQRGGVREAEGAAQEELRCRGGCWWGRRGSPSPR